MAPTGDGATHPPTGDGATHPPTGDGASHPPADDGASHPPADDASGERPAPSSSAVPYVRMTGRGGPVTIFGHGFGGSIADTRPFGAGVEGTRAFLHFRGHGGRPAPSTPWTYDELAGELRTAADGVNATRALGVSMGAGALANILSRTPDRFERVAFVLPAVLDGTGEGESRRRAIERSDRLAELVAAGDRDAIVRAYAEREPVSVRAIPAAQAWFEHQADQLLTTDARHGLSLPHRLAIPDAEALSAVVAPALVLTHEHDDAHPVSVAEAYAAALPHAKLVVLPEGSILWLGRTAVREAITTFFND